MSRTMKLSNLHEAEPQPAGELLSMLAIAFYMCFSLFLHPSSRFREAASAHTRTTAIGTPIAQIGNMTAPVVPMSGYDAGQEM